MAPRMLAPRMLAPFRSEPQLEGLQLQATATWDGAVLSLHYGLCGALAAWRLPPPAAQPARRDGLWQSTCFEAFFGVPGQPQYWEINLAPSGDWNLYALSAYREGLRPEPAVSRLPFRLVRPDAWPDPSATQELQLSFELDLRSLIKAAAPLELSATAVLDHREHGCSYWAWRHTGQEADFHRRDSFLPL
ncbi:MAG: hypothetical protein RLZZ423_702 [Cyanobacteriota bacterium]|jgi:hypothetical protein